MSKVEKDDDSEEEEKNGQGSFVEDYIVYQNQGETFPALLQLVQARLNRIQNQITVIKTSNAGKQKRPETFGNKQESLIVTVSPEQREEINKLVVHEESQQVFSLADMMNMMKQLLKYKKDAMDTKIQNNELKIQLKNYKPETSPREKTPVVDDKEEAENNFAEILPVAPG